MEVKRLPWPLYRLAVRYRMWRNSAADLNRRTEVEQALIVGAKSGLGIPAESCIALARKLGTSL